MAPCSAQAERCHVVGPQGHAGFRLEQHADRRAALAEELSADLAQITFDYPFRIPPYFALIIRAISVLEGIALVGNDDFAMIDEAYPYIAQRLLTDDSPRLRESLKYMIYGRDNVFDAERLIDMLNAFETFTVHSRSATGDLSIAATGHNRFPTSRDLPVRSGGTWPPALQLPFPLLPGIGAGSTAGDLVGVATGLLAQGPLALAGILGLPERIPDAVPVSAMAETSGAGAPPMPVPPPAGWQQAGAAPDNSGSRAALLFLVSDEGAFFRTFLMDEIVRSIDALSRDQLAQLVKRLNLGGTVFPVFLPGAKRTSIALSPDVDEEDRNQVESVAKLIDFLAGGSVQRMLSGNGADLLPLLPRVAQQILPEVSLRLVSRIAARFVRTFYM
jgi:aarF domain-containing kinase